MHPVNAERRKNFQEDPVPPVDAQWRTRVAYYGLCTFLDRQVETIIKALEDTGMADNTIVVYTSDHGEMLGEHGMWWKSTFYDGACRVPLIVSWPDRIKGGRSVTHNVSLMDIGMTLMDMTGLESLPGTSGRSFHALMTGNSDGWDDTVFAEYTGRHLETSGRMVRSGRWKYNHYHGMRPELFDLEADPDEKEDLWEDPDCRDIRRQLQELALKDWDPDRVAAYMRRCTRERQLIGHWVNTVGPEEPDLLWFDEPPENWVDNTVRSKR